MDGETLENVGLAETIQNGLNSSLMKAIKWCSPEQLAAKKAELTVDKAGALYALPLTAYVMKHWADQNGIDLSSLKSRRNSSAAGRQGSKVGAKLSTPKNVLSEDHNVERLRKHNEEKSGAVRKQSGSSNSGRKLRVSPGVAKFTWHE